VSTLLRTTFLLLGLCAAAARPAGAQDGTTPPAGRPGAVLERLRERWSARPQEERARLERHLEEFQKLPPQTRRKLLERARALRERERSIELAAPHELKQRMEELGPERARELWREHLRERVRERGRELRLRLPPDMRAQLEQAPPDVRRRLLERLVLEYEHRSREVLSGLRERRGLSPREVQRLERLPLPERLRALRELGRGSG
jgi:hypothetical protein